MMKRELFSLIAIVLLLLPGIFPLFWDIRPDLAVDLRSPKQRAVLLDPESEDLAGTAYASFEDFLHDAIRANEGDDDLVCFQVR